MFSSRLSFPRGFEELDRPRGERLLKYTPTRCEENGQPCCQSFLCKSLSFRRLEQEAKARLQQSAPQRKVDSRFARNRGGARGSLWRADATLNLGRSIVGRLLQEGFFGTLHVLQNDDTRVLVHGLSGCSAGRYERDSCLPVGRLRSADALLPSTRFAPLRASPSADGLRASRMTTRGRQVRWGRA